MSKRKSKLKKSFSNDGLRDALSGIGGEKDILATGMMGFANYVTSNATMLERMYRANIWVKKAVSIPANYAVKGWRLLEDKDIEKAEQKINLKENIALSLKWGELFGGSMVVFIVDDGQSPDQPINYKKLKPDSFKRLIVVDRWKVTNSEIINKDVLSDDFMQPEYYMVQIEGQIINFHPSRVHKIVPNKLTLNEEKREQYWGVSQIEIIYRQLIADDVFISNLANMMKKSTLDIFSIPNLSGLILSGQEEQIQKRLRINQMTMSTLNAYVKDAGVGGQNAETYERITQQFTGFDSLDIQSQARIASACEIPATIFLGKSPDGMNATGYSDLSIFADRLSSIRELLIDPLLYKIDNIFKACFNKDKDIRYEWSNPFPKSAKEEADIRLTNIQVIEKMVALDLPNVVLADKLVDYELIDSVHKDEVLKSLEIEPFEIEDELLDNIAHDSNIGTYVSSKVINGKSLYDWFRSQGIETLKEDDFHSTISYSRKPFNHIPDNRQLTISPKDFLKIEPLGDEGAIVLKYKSKDMKDRFDKCISEGATYDYDSYIPHITITYNGKGIDIENIKMPNFDIYLSGEVVEPLNLNWKDEL